MPRARRYRVSGRVQGVGFRYHTRLQAQQLGLAGWVRNMADGRVEVLAAGGSEVLERFEQWLAAGPPASSVQGVEAHPVEATPDELPEPFEVRF